MSDSQLTTASFLVLGLVEAGGEVTPYDLKTAAAATVNNFWALPHTQIYTQCDRLAKQGLLNESREDHGRRRRVFSITDEGKQALDEWRTAPTPGDIEIRDLSILKLFFNADPKQLAADQLPFHEAQLAELKQFQRDVGPHMSEGGQLALKIGIGHSEEFVRFWRSVAEDA